MEFTPLLENRYSGNLILDLCVGAGLCFTIIMFTIAITTSLMDGESSLKYWWITSCLLILTLFAVLPTQIENDKIKTRNQVIVEENMKKKYRINSVLWDELGTNVQDYEGKSVIAVRDDEDNIVNYRYHVNPTTFEPSLINIPESSWRETTRPSKELLKTND